MMNSINGLDGTQELLIKLLEQNPDDWGMRKKVVWFLYEAGYFREASKVVWNAPEIPSEDKEVVFAARIVSKGQPIRAMRLLNAVIERNRDEPKKNLAMAKELVKGGMPLQATRFYGAATLSDSSLIDEDFEVCLITTDADEEDWNEIVQGDEFPWDAPIELSEADLATSDHDAKDKVDEVESGAVQPVPLKPQAKSMKDTVEDSEKAVDLRQEKKPLPLNPDKISTRAVTMSVLNKDSEDVDSKSSSSEEASKKSSETQADKVKKVEESEKVDKPDVVVTTEEEVVAKDEPKEVDPIEEVADVEDVKDEPPVSEEPKPASPEVKPLTVRAPIALVKPEDIADEVEEVVESVEEEQIQEEEVIEDSYVEEEIDEPVAAKKGMFSALTGFFRRSKKEKSKAQVNTHALNTSTAVTKPTLMQPKAFTKPTIVAGGAGSARPMAGPVKLKPVPVPSELKAGGRRYGQPEALDCRTRLVALAPQDGSAFFDELTKKYATVSGSQMPEVVQVAKNEADVDYLDLIQKACSNDKSVSLDSFSQLLGLHAVMTTADCSAWVEDMNLLRQGFGDAVLATVVSKYSVSECRDILGAVYRRIATQAAV